MNKRVQKLIRDDRLIKTTGPQLARQIRLRLNQMRSAETFGDYLRIGLGKPHSLSSDKKGKYGTTISGNFRLVYSPVYKQENDSPDEVDELIIIGVGDYHGGKDNWIIP